MSQPDKVWAHCPNCQHSSRFLRFEVNHRMHALFTVLTLGLWGISWVALAIGQHMHPWRCNQCGWNEPDFEKHLKSRGKKGEPTSPAPTAANADTPEK